MAGSPGGDVGPLPRPLGWPGRRRACPPCMPAVLLSPGWGGLVGARAAPPPTRGAPGRAPAPPPGRERFFFFGGGVLLGAPRGAANLEWAGLRPPAGAQACRYALDRVHGTGRARAGAAPGPRSPPRARNANFPRKAPRGGGGEGARAFAAHAGRPALPARPLPLAWLGTGTRAPRRGGVVGRARPPPRRGPPRICGPPLGRKARAHLFFPSLTTCPLPTTSATRLRGDRLPLLLLLQGPRR